MGKYGKSTISTGPFSIAFCMFTRPGPVMDGWYRSSQKPQSHVAALPEKTLQATGSKCWAVLGELHATPGPAVSPMG